MTQAPLFVQQGTLSHTDTLGDGGAADFAAPSLHDFSGRHAVSEFVEDLPDHDPCAFEGGFAVADQWISDDVFTEFEAFGFAVRFRSHTVAEDSRLAEGDLQACGGKAEG